MIKTVINRRGISEDIDLNKIINRIGDLSTNTLYGKPLDIDVNKIVIETIKNVYNGVKTTELDEQSGRIAFSMYFQHEDYGKLAARIAISSYIKNIKIRLEGRHIWNLLKGVLAPNIIGIFENTDISSLLCEYRNYSYSYNAFYLMQRGYLLSELGGSPIETPDFAKLRVAVGIVMGNRSIMTGNDREFIKSIYLNRKYTHATPTLFNAGTINPQLSSCILIDIEDNLNSILKSIEWSAISQKYSSGIGISFSSLRGRDSLIRGTNGKSSGLSPLAEVFDKLGYYIDQGGGKRTGSISPYIACWHQDLLETLQLRDIKDVEQAKNHHRLYYAVWTSNIFYEYFEKNMTWYFFSPDDTPELIDLYGEEFDKKYEEYVKLGVYKSSMNAREVWDSILRIQAIAGVPYIVNKDNINMLRNQNHSIRSSNLCAEITLPTNKDEIGVCNLASISIKKFLSKKIKGDISYKNPINGRIYYLNTGELEQTVRLIVRALDRIIDVNYYPLPEAEYSNKTRRPMGIGIMGLADALCKCGLVFGSEEACNFRANIQEIIYYYAVDESCELFNKLSRDEKLLNMGGKYSEYRSGQGMLHPQLFDKYFGIKYKQLFDWNKLAKKAVGGMRNSVLTACMPTGSVARIMENSACFEPYESNIYKHSAFATDLVVMNKYLRKDLRHIGIIGGPKNDLFINRFTKLSGKIGDLELKNYKPYSYITQNTLDVLKKIYRVACFEISPKEIIDMCAAAQPYIDQSQSMNLWTEKVSINTFNWYNYARKSGLKTGCYYLKSDTATKEEVCKNCVI